MGNLLRLSESVTLALHVMVILAQDEGRSTTPRLAERFRASPHTLAKVFQSLARAGLVKAVRGPKGGFTLARPADQISLLDIFEAIDGPLGKPRCPLSRPFCDGSRCVLGGLVESVQEEGRDYFSRTTVAELARTIVFRGQSEDRSRTARVRGGERRKRGPR